MSQQPRSQGSLLHVERETGNKVDASQVIRESGIAYSVILSEATNDRMFPDTSGVFQMVFSML